MTAILGPQGPMVTEEVLLLFVYGSRFTIVFHAVRRCASASMFANKIVWHEKAALWVVGANHSEDHQGTAYHPALRHAQDVPEISQYPLSDRTQQVDHWRCCCVPIVLVSDDMQASAVEAVDTAHHCSSQRPCLGRLCQSGTHCQSVCPQFQCPRQSVVVPDLRQ